MEELNNIKDLEKEIEEFVFSNKADKEVNNWIGVSELDSQTKEDISFLVIISRLLYKYDILKSPLKEKNFFCNYECVVLELDKEFVEDYKYDNIDKAVLYNVSEAYDFFVILYNIIISTSKKSKITKE